MDAAIQAYGDMALSRMTEPPALKSRNPRDVSKTAQDFEAMFMTQMLQPMFQTVDVNSTFGGGHGEEVMRTFMVQEYGKMIAKSGHLGIADSIKRAMIQMQGVKNPADQGVAHVSAQ